MSDISIQFYATPLEHLTFVRGIMRNFDLHAVAMRFRPFEAREVDVADLDAYFLGSSNFHRWAFTVDAPLLPVEHELDHADKNPDHLRLQVGEFNSTHLSQSWLSCRTTNDAIFRIWREIARRLKESTKGGVTATNRDTGASSEYKSFRYTAGAKALEEKGVRILPAIGLKGPITRLGLLLSQPTE